MNRSRRGKRIRIAILVLSILTLGGLALSWFVAGALIAPAPRFVGPPPSDMHVTSIELTSESGSMIRGWHTHADGNKGVIVLLHGIRGCRLTMLSRARLLNELGYSTVMIDLQAHGESSGECITVGHLEKMDVRSAVAFARREHPHEPIGIIGTSLGGASALLASPLSVDAMVLESVFPDIDSAIYNRVAARLGPFASIPVALLRVQLGPRLGISPSQLRPIDRIANVGCPVYIMSGTNDVHTTASETKEMFTRAPDPKELWLVEGAAHVDLLAYSPIEYQTKVGGFFEQHFTAAVQRLSKPK